MIDKRKCACRIAFVSFLLYLLMVHVFFLVTQSPTAVPQGSRSFDNDDILKGPSMKLTYADALLNLPVDATLRTYLNQQGMEFPPDFDWTDDPATSTAGRQ